jgi:hypothetical protein
MRVHHKLAAVPSQTSDTFRLSSPTPRQPELAAAAIFPLFSGNYPQSESDKAPDACIMKQE